MAVFPHSGTVRSPLVGSLIEVFRWTKLIERLLSCGLLGERYSVLYLYESVLNVPISCHCDYDAQLCGYNSLRCVCVCVRERECVCTCV